MFSLFNTLDSAFTFIATAYLFIVGIALTFGVIQSVWVEFINANAVPVSNEFYEQVKVALAIEPEESVNPQGKALVLTVTEPTEQPEELPVAVVTPEPEPQIKAITPEIVTDFWADIDFSKMNIRTIREYVRAHSLQSLIRDRIGKSVSRCSLNELRQALSA